MSPKENWNGKNNSIYHRGHRWVQKTQTEANQMVKSLFVLGSSGDGRFSQSAGVASPIGTGAPTGQIALTKATP
jgi:hypothetical protein